MMSSDVAFRAHNLFDNNKREKLEKILIESEHSVGLFREFFSEKRYFSNDLFRDQSLSDISDLILELDNTRESSIKDFMHTLFNLFSIHKGIVDNKPAHKEDYRFDFINLGIPLKKEYRQFITFDHNKKLEAYYTNIINIFSKTSNKLFNDDKSLFSKYLSIVNEFSKKGVVPNNFLLGIAELLNKDDLLSDYLANANKLISHFKSILGSDIFSLNNILNAYAFGAKELLINFSSSPVSKNKNLSSIINEFVSQGLNAGKYSPEASYAFFYSFQNLFLNKFTTEDINNYLKYSRQVIDFPVEAQARLMSIGFIASKGKKYVNKIINSFNFLNQFSEAVDNSLLKKQVFERMARHFSLFFFLDQDFLVDKYFSFINPLSELADLVKKITFDKPRDISYFPDYFFAFLSNHSELLIELNYNLFFFPESHINLSRKTELLLPEERKAKERLIVEWFFPKQNPQLSETNVSDSVFSSLQEKNKHYKQIKKILIKNSHLLDEKYYNDLKIVFTSNKNKTFLNPLIYENNIELLDLIRSNNWRQKIFFRNPTDSSLYLLVIPNLINNSLDAFSSLIDIILKGDSYRSGHLSLLDKVFVKNILQKVSSKDISSNPIVQRVKRNPGEGVRPSELDSLVEFISKSVLKKKHFLEESLKIKLLKDLNVHPYYAVEVHESKLEDYLDNFDMCFLYSQKYSREGFNFLTDKNSSIINFKSYEHDPSFVDLGLELGRSLAKVPLMRANVDGRDVLYVAGIQGLDYLTIVNGFYEGLFSSLAKIKGDWDGLFFDLNPRNNHLLSHDFAMRLANVLGFERDKDYFYDYRKIGKRSSMRFRIKNPDIKRISLYRSNDGPVFLEGLLADPSEFNDPDARPSTFVDSAYVVGAYISMSDFEKLVVNNLGSVNYSRKRVIARRFGF